jgi:Ca-activated chloride channel family protein
MRTLARVVALALALPFSEGAVAAQAVQPPVFGAATQAIYIDVTLERPTSGAPRLAASDFRLFDNGAPQTFELVPADELPVRAILVFDTSGSMQGEKLDQLSRAALDLIARLGPKDEASLLTFSNGFEWSGAPNPDLVRVQAGLKQLRAEGATSLYDALYSALVLPGVSSRTLVVLFSDGSDTSSWLTDAKIRTVAERSNALIHAVALPDRVLDLVAAPSMASRSGGSSIAMTGGPSVVVPGEAAAYLQSLRELAESTGGSLVTVQSARQIGKAFTSILDEVRARYVLRYDPATTPAPGWHKLEVRLASGRKERLRTRSGYWFR